LGFFCWGQQRTGIITLLEDVEFWRELFKKFDIIFLEKAQ